MGKAKGALMIRLCVCVCKYGIKTLCTGMCIVVVEFKTDDDDVKITHVFKYLTVTNTNKDRE